jgi:cyd operon protein YbgT
MWYFSWVLGVGFACSFAVLNAMWLELQTDQNVGAVRGRIRSNEGDAEHPFA